MKQARFTVVLSEMTPETVTVEYTTQDGTAIAPDFYEAKSGVLTFQPGETEKDIFISIVDPYPSTVQTQFSVQLSSSNNANIADGEGIITLGDPTCYVTYSDELALSIGYGPINYDQETQVLSKAIGSSIGLADLGYPSISNPPTLPVYNDVRALEISVDTANTPQGIQMQWNITDQSGNDISALISVGVKETNYLPEDIISQYGAAKLNNNIVLQLDNPDRISKVMNFPEGIDYTNWVEYNNVFNEGGYNKSINQIAINATRQVNVPNKLMAHTGTGEGIAFSDDGVNWETYFNGCRYDAEGDSANTLNYGLVLGSYIYAFNTSLPHYHNQLDIQPNKKFWSPVLEPDLITTYSNPQVGTLVHPITGKGHVYTYEGDFYGNGVTKVLIFNTDGSFDRLETCTSNTSKVPSSLFHKSDYRLYAREEGQSSGDLYTSTDGIVWTKCNFYDYQGDPDNLFGSQFIHVASYGNGFFIGRYISNNGTDFYGNYNIYGDYYSGSDGIMVIDENGDIYYNSPGTIAQSSGNLEGQDLYIPFSASTPFYADYSSGGSVHYISNSNKVIYTNAVTGQWWVAEDGHIVNSGTWSEVPITPIKEHLQGNIEYHYSTTFNGIPNSEIQGNFIIGIGDNGKLVVCLDLDTGVWTYVLPYLPGAQYGFGGDNSIAYLNNYYIKTGGGTPRTLSFFNVNDPEDIYTRSIPEEVANNDLLLCARHDGTLAIWSASGITSGGLGEVGGICTTTDGVTYSPLITIPNPTVEGNLIDRTPSKFFDTGLGYYIVHFYDSSTYYTFKLAYDGEELIYLGSEFYDRPVEVLPLPELNACLLSAKPDSSFDNHKLFITYDMETLEELPSLGSGKFDVDQVWIKNNRLYVFAFGTNSVDGIYSTDLSEGIGNSPWVLETRVSQYTAGVSGHNQINVTDKANVMVIVDGANKFLIIIANGQVLAELSFMGLVGELTQGNYILAIDGIQAVVNSAKSNFTANNVQLLELVNGNDWCGN